MSKNVKVEWDESDGEKWETDDEPLVSALSFGWMEDGRCGYPAAGNFIQSCPRPVTGLQKTASASGKLYVCKKASGGSRHTAFLMVNTKKEGGGSAFKTKRIGIIGLNQQGLCEEPGFTSMTDIPWDAQEQPVDVVAGAGFTFVITKHGNLYSCGNGKYGVLGHGDDITMQTPRQLMSLLKQHVRAVAVGRSHVLAMMYNAKVWCWGRNNKGQLGLGFESQPMKGSQNSNTQALVDKMVDVRNKDQEYYSPEVIPYFTANEKILGIACGDFHSMALVQATNKNNSTKQVIYVWGDDSKGQLGSSDGSLRSKPQENRWVTQLMNKLQCLTVASIAAGGGTCLVLLEGPGQGIDAPMISLIVILCSLYFCTLYSHILGCGRVWTIRTWIRMG